MCVGSSYLKATTSIKKMAVKSLLHVSSSFLSLSLSMKIDLALLMRVCVSGQMLPSGYLDRWSLACSSGTSLSDYANLAWGNASMSTDLHMADPHVKEREPFMS